MTPLAPDADILIAGGGPAGAACAILLARAGRSVTVIEREAGPREKVCGEFLGGDAQACLAALGLDAAALGAVPILGGSVARRGGETRFALPFAAMGLRRAAMDEALLAQAARAGAVLHRGDVVRDATRRDDGWKLRLAGGATLRARHFVLATGKHALRGFPRDGAGEGWIGAKLHIRLPMRTEAVTLLPCQGGYAGLQPSGDGEANLCAALAGGPGDALRDADRFLALIRAGSPLGARLLEGAQPTMARPITIAGVPYGFLHRDRPRADPCLWRLGDQFAVIPSFLGDGMAMAMASGMAAAQAILEGDTAPRFHARWRRHVATPMRIAAASSLVMRNAPGLFGDIVGMVPGLARQVARRTRVTVPDMRQRIAAAPP